jgi:chemotaxis protein methyltransferase CheR
LLFIIVSQPTALKKLEEALAEYYGWAATPSARAKINAAIESKAGRLQIEPAEYCLIAAGSQSEMLALVEEAAVGETYFFREPTQFAALRKLILPRITAAHPATDTLRLWSAACSTGEEAYSLAITIDQLRQPEDDRTIEIFATDVRNRALLAASQAHYQLPALRQIDTATRAKYFDHTGGTPDAPLSGIYTVIPDLRKRVTFRRINLLDALFWKGMGRRFDLILCANLLLYLHGAAMRQMIARLNQSLRPGGYLMVAPAEVSFLEHSGLRPIKEAPTFFQRVS